MYLSEEKFSQYSDPRSLENKRFEIPLEQFPKFYD